MPVPGFTPIVSILFVLLIILRTWPLPNPEVIRTALFNHWSTVQFLAASSIVKGPDPVRIPVSNGMVLSSRILYV